MCGQSLDATLRYFWCRSSIRIKFFIVRIIKMKLKFWLNINIKNIYEIISKSSHCMHQYINWREYLSSIQVYHLGDNREIGKEFKRAIWNGTNSFQ